MKGLSQSREVNADRCESRMEASICIVKATGRFRTGEFVVGETAILAEALGNCME